jgi:hypothetical protein
LPTIRAIIELLISLFDIPVFIASNFNGFLHPSLTMPVLFFRCFPSFLGKSPSLFEKIFQEVIPAMRGALRIESILPQARGRGLETVSEHGGRSGACGGRGEGRLEPAYPARAIPRKRAPVRPGRGSRRPSALRPSGLRTWVAASWLRRVAGRRGRWIRAKRPRQTPRAGVVSVAHKIIGRGVTAPARPLRPWPKGEEKRQPPDRTRSRQRESLPLRGRFLRSAL